jgi:ABC-type nitrate/sulfonate/bicarbonate transport system substrate-binding protein
MTAVVADAAQIGFSNVLALSIAHQRQIPVQLLAPGVEYDSNAPNVALLVARDSQITTAKQCENAVVAVTGLHDLLALATEAWLAKSGVDPGKVKFVEIPPRRDGRSVARGAR